MITNVFDSLKKIRCPLTIVFLINLQMLFSSGPKKYLLVDLKDVGVVRTVCTIAVCIGTVACTIVVTRVGVSTVGVSAVGVPAVGVSAIGVPAVGGTIVIFVPSLVAGKEE